ncbi:hypothetical protein Pint_10959 [Pistacia integerrima]|uniref:Uncharacterized protein n=1 Tax=Pistacia integerrima TaxID=434235 RepID=A0ACC0XID8_9ROSI|nr:hypothetical protein Pint_10959 [Pistacia integerrima]
MKEEVISSGGTMDPTPAARVLGVFVVELVGFCSV